MCMYICWLTDLWPVCLCCHGSYVSAMVPVKSMKEYDVMQEVIVLFCETVLRYVTMATIHITIAPQAWAWNSKNGLILLKFYYYIFCRSEKGGVQNFFSLGLFLKKGQQITLTQHSKWFPNLPVVRRLTVIDCTTVSPHVVGDNTVTMGRYDCGAQTRNYITVWNYGNHLLIVNQFICMWQAFCAHIYIYAILKCVQ